MPYFSFLSADYRLATDLQMVCRSNTDKNNKKQLNQILITTEIDVFGSFTKVKVATVPN